MLLEIALSVEEMSLNTWRGICHRNQPTVWTICLHLGLTALNATKYEIAQMDSTVSIANNPPYTDIYSTNCRISAMFLKYNFVCIFLNSTLFKVRFKKK